jgi:hypothetical protein
MTCPICFNSISSNTRLRGADGVDEYGDPTPFWTDDPLLTPTGFAGLDYIGISPIRYIHIKELQSYYSSLEIAIGISDPTEFIELFDRDPIVIVQLRISVEKILTAIGMTISDYFKSDRHGNLIETTQTDWTDVDRSEGIPNLSPNYPIRACHIEELRRGMLIGFNTLFCHSGYNGDYLLPGLGVFSNNTKYFRKFERINEHGWNENMWNCLVHQFNTWYLFSTGDWTSGYFAPTYSWNETNDLSIENWQGWEPTWDETFVCQFDPPLPLSEEGTEWGGYEGVQSIAVDDTHDDYYMYTNELFYSRIGFEGYMASDFDNYSFIWSGCPSYIAKYKFPKQRILGYSNGDPNQTFNAGSTGIRLPVVNGGEKVLVNDVVWTKVIDFSGSNPTDIHYTFSNDTGVITFGNGVKGMIPLVGSEIKIFITLKGGGIWEYLGIVVPRDITKEIDGIMIANGKLYYQSSAIESCRIESRDINIQMHNGTYGDDGVNKTWTWDFQNNIGHLHHQGSYALFPLTGWQGLLDQAIWYDTAYYGTQPNVSSDSMFGFDVEYHYGNCSDHWGIKWVTNRKSLKRRGYTEFGIRACEESTHLGGDTSNMIQFRVYKDSGRTYAQMFDLTHPTDIRSIMTNHGNYYDKVVGNVTWILGVGGAWTGLCQRWQTHTLVRPSTYVPMIMKVRDDNPGNSGLLFGNPIFSPYTYKWEITELTL